ncbi:MAG: DUF3943 domain-containing protein [Williamsia sp.]|nr:DUF3943 domain-containing protein [Williamsia sp.]
MLQLLGLLAFSVAAAAQQPAARQNPGKGKAVKDAIAGPQATASFTLLAMEVLPWSYNHFVRKADFTRVNFRTITANLLPQNWEWDDNRFTNNQFAHPYHGQLYYNAYRTNGSSFWGSVPAALAGSFLWEVAGETHHAAPNDLINTTWGGITLGEITYRLSQALVHKPGRGVERQAREVLALLVNPLNGFHRISARQWGRRSTDSSAGPELAVQLDLGSRRYSETINKTIRDGKNEVFVRLHLTYGSEGRNSKEPFGYFTASLEGGSSDTARLNLLRVEGRVTSWIIREEERHTENFSLTLDYDYLKNAAFSYGAQHMQGRWFNQWLQPNGRSIVLIGQAGPVLLAAVPDPYLYIGEGRNYDYGSGAAAGVVFRWQLSRKLAYQVDQRFHWFQTLNGSRSHYTLWLTTSEIQYQPVRRLFLKWEWGNFLLDGRYSEQASIRRQYPYNRFSIGWSVGRHP